MNDKGNKILFIEPYYSGAVCLIEEGINFYELGKEISFDSYHDSIDCLDKVLEYEYQLLDKKFLSRRIVEKKKEEKRKEAQRLIYFYEEMFRTNEISLVIVWNGFEIKTSTAVHAAKNCSISSIYLEKGLLPKYLQVDHIGINAFNSGKNSIDKYLQHPIIYPIKHFHEMLQSTWVLKNPFKKISKYSKMRYFLDRRLYKELFHHFHYSLITKFEDIVNSLSNGLIIFFTKYRWKKYDEILKIFVPFQVSVDSQLLLSGGWTTSNIALIENIMAAIKKKDSSLIVVKPHPWEKHDRINWNLIWRYKNLVFSNENTIELILRSSVVITINSTVGFESILFGKPTILLGDALYSNVELIKSAKSVEELNNMLHNLNMNMIEKQKIERLVNCVEKLLVLCDFNNPSEEDIYRLFHKINDQVKSYSS